MPQVHVQERESHVFSDHRYDGLVDFVSGKMLTHLMNSIQSVRTNSSVITWWGLAFVLSCWSERRVIMRVDEFAQWSPGAACIIIITSMLSLIKAFIF